MKNITFCNIIFRGINKDCLLSEESKLKFIVTANAEFIVYANNNSYFKKILNHNLTTLDGQIPYWLAQLQNRHVTLEKLSGSDLIYDFCEMARTEKKRVFLLGGYLESNRGAVDVLRKMYGIAIDGFSPAYKPFPFDADHNDTILTRIESFRPDILLVGFGALKQELWIDKNFQYLNDIGVRWVIGVGGTFEFVSGQIARAPIIIQRVGLEGIYRFAQEPKWFRLKRIFVSLKIFKYI